MEYCYELGHYYENERGMDIFKILGIFSTREKAEQAQIMYSKKPGFRDGLLLYRQASHKHRKLGYRICA